MITNTGKPVILKALTPLGESFAATMGFGIDDSPVSPTDESLGFEIIRTPVDIVDYDESNSRVLVRAIVPAETILDIHEVGLFTLDERTDSEFLSDIISFFDDSEDEWDGFDSLETSGVRSGNAAFRLDMGGGSGAITHLENMIPFDAMLSTSKLALAYQRLGSAASCEFRAHVDASNYRSYSFSLDAGFGVERWARSDFSETGSAPWEDIEYLVIAFSGGGPILLEGLRQDELVPTSDVLVSRHVPATPIKNTGVSEVQFEYALEVTFD